MTSDFPIQQVIPDVKKVLQKQNLLILQAPPGAGKSTILPLQLLEEDWLKEKKIILLEPRRLAARAVASRMADLLNEPIGQTVGFRIRFDTKVSSKTRIEIVTEGILTRMLQNDSTLEQAGLVIFDEFHERSLQADLSLALCYQMQQVLRNDLRILIMSATLDGEKLSALLHNAPVLTSQGRQYPVAIRYCAFDEHLPLSINLVRIILKACKETTGDMLVFLPGTGDILRTMELLEKETIAARILPLYGDLPLDKQQEAILPNKQGHRKIVLSTSIAETSLTIEGIKIVIDSGFSRVPRFDPKSGMTRLETVRVTKDAAEQRTGRAGRTSEGICYRLWTEGQHLHLTPHRKPEILEADLTPLLLELGKWGVSNMEELYWLTIPPAGTQAKAKELLHTLEALKNNQITPKGKRMLELPTHPRFSHLLLTATDMEKQAPAILYAALACDIVALLEEKDPLLKENSADLSLRIELLRKYRNNEPVNANRNTLQRIERLAASWRKLLTIDTDNQPPNPFHTGALIALAYPERIAKRLEKQGFRYRIGNGRTARLPEHDTLCGNEWIAIAQLDSGTTEGKIFLAAPFNISDLAHLSIERTIVTWDKERQMVIATLQKEVGNHITESKPVQQINQDERVTVICKMIREEGLRIFNAGDELQEWQARIMSLRTWRPAEEWPDVSEAQLLATLEEWLTPYLTTIYKLAELQKLNLIEILQATLPWALSQKVDILAPSKIKVPTGSLIKLTYTPDGSKVEMAVRLQEVFGLMETPKVNEGKKGIIMHLLSPGYKPVQITQDLKSFWTTTYFEVKKDLLSRYPKHHWPDNPLTAEAVRGPKKRTS